MDVVLGGKAYPVETPFSFKVLRLFTPAFVKFGGKLNTPEAFDALAEAIIVCVREKTPEFARSTLDSMAVTPNELLKAADDLALASGLFRKPTTGEAAGEGSQSTGDTSTPT